MTHRVYFVDTSYLLELYKVPGNCNDVAAAAVRGKFWEARQNDDRLFVPLGCILETGNHIADLGDADHRVKWAKLLLSDVLTAVDDSSKTRPFVIVPAPNVQDIAALITAWTDRHCKQERGLVDAATAEAAIAFKKNRAMGAPVHIWTRDRALKGLEPDK